MKDLTEPQQQALTAAREILAQEARSGAPMNMRRSLLRVALENIVEEFTERPRLRGTEGEPE